MGFTEDIMSMNRLPKSGCGVDCDVPYRREEYPEECCATCRFSRGGECRRNPPFLMIIGQKYDPVWPRVKDLGWCGEWKNRNVVDAVDASGRQETGQNAGLLELARRPLFEDNLVVKATDVL